MAKFRQAVKNYLSNTFRPRKFADYSEVFTRGADGLRRSRYPWLYSRVIWALFALYAVCATVEFFAPNALFAPSVVFLGGAFVNFSYLVLCFELYPKRDLSLFGFVFCMIAGGALSICIAVLGYRFIADPSAAYVGEIWTGFLEEFSKATVTIALILIAKRRSPFLGFLIGTSVGVGFSFFEDIGYIFEASVFGGGVASAVTRATGAPFGHPMWAGLFGWAVGTFKKPYINWRVYGAFALAVCLHFIWNLPFGDKLSVLLEAGCSVFIFVVTVVIIIYSRGFILQTMPVNGEEPPPTASRGLRLGIAADCAAFAAVLLFGVFSLTAVYLDGLSDTLEYREASVGEFITLAQEGKSLEYKDGRPYNPLMTDCYSEYIEGRKVTAVQKDGEFYYYYTGDFPTFYDVSTLPELSDVYVVYCEEQYVAYKFHFVGEPDADTCQVAHDGDGIHYYFFLLNDDIRGVGFTDGKVEYSFYNTNDYTSAENWLFSFGAGFAAAGVAAFTVLKILSRRKDNV